MAGETQRYREQLRAQVDDATYTEVIDLSKQILERLPATTRFGSLAAALQLAAISYSEHGIAAARAMVEESRNK